MTGMAVAAQIHAVHLLEGDFRDRRHAVIALLAGHGDMREAHRLEGGTRKLILLALDLLETEHVGVFGAHEALNEIEPKANGVDIPRGQSETHDQAC